MWSSMYKTTVELVSNIWLAQAKMLQKSCLSNLIVLDDELHISLIPELDSVHVKCDVFKLA